MEKTTEFIKSRAELLLVLLTMICTLFSGIWGLSKLDSRMVMQEEFRMEARPILAKVNLIELRVDRQCDLMKKIDINVSEIQKALWSHMGKENNKTGDNKSTFGLVD